LHNEPATLFIQNCLSVQVEAKRKRV